MNSETARLSNLYDIQSLDGPITEILNAFTVDVEDYYQVSAFEPHVARDEWDVYPSRVERNTHRMLALLDRHDVKATFFVLGWVADRFPQLVRDIGNCGHEIGCHSFGHRLIYQQTPDEFRDDLRQARDAIESACTADVVGLSGTELFDHTPESLGPPDPGRRGLHGR